MTHIGSVQLANPEDSVRYTGLLLQISRVLDLNAEEHCAIFRIRSGEIRRRGLDNRGRISNLFQGYYPIGATREQDRIYPGDDKIRVDDQISIQLHRLDLVEDSTTVAHDVPTLAVWVPRRMSAEWIVQ